MPKSVVLRSSLTALALIATATLACSGAETDSPPIAESAADPVSAPPSLPACTEDLITWSPAGGACTGPWETIDYIDSHVVSELDFHAHPVVEGKCSWLYTTQLCMPDGPDTCVPLAQQAIDDFVAARPNALMYGLHVASSLPTPVDGTHVQLHCSARAYATPSLQSELAYTESGLTEAEARGRRTLGIGPPLPPRPTAATYTCTSCEDLPTRSDHDVQEKFDCIAKHRDDLLSYFGPSPTGEQWPDVQMLSSQLRLLFELHGHLLDRRQVDDVIALYRDEPRAHHACGTSIEPLLDKPLVDGSEWALTYCTHLADAHVPTVLLMSHQPALLAPCHQLLGSAATPEDFERLAALNLELLEKVYAEMGSRLAQARTAADRVDAIARALTVVQAWYEARASANVDPDVDGDRAAALAAVLAHVEATRRVRDSLLDALLTGSNVEANRDLEERIAGVDSRRVDGDALELALGDTQGVATEIEQELIRAALADPLGAQQPALRGVLLLDLLGLVLDPLVDRLEVVTPSHDLACLLADCGPVGNSVARATPTSRLWALVATLDEAATDQNAALAATPFNLSGWRDLFAEVSRHDAAVKDALGQLVGHPYSPGELETIDRLQAPPSTIRFVSAVVRAKSRHRGYTRTGQLIGVSTRELGTGLDAQKRDDVVRYLAGQRANLEARAARHGDEIVRLMQGLIAERNNDATIARLVEKRERLVDEAELLSDRRRAQMTAVSETDRASDLAHALAQVQGAIDGAPYVVVTNHSVRQISARDARYHGAAWSISDVTNQVPIAVGAGHILSVAVEGQWAPTCALTRAPFVSADGQGTVPVTLSRSTTGPEGYSVVWTGSAYEAQSSSSQQSNSNTVGIRAEVCSGFGLTFGSVTACAYADANLSQTWSQSDGSGDERRTAASLVSGVYLASTPLFAPAGSLLVVEMPRGVTQLSAARQVHVVRGPHTSVSASADADLYLVVNDLACSGADPTPLTVQLRTLASASNVASQILARIARVQQAIRAARPAMIERGEILGGELAQIRSDALTAAISGSGPVIPVADYPVPLLALLEATVDRELVNLERVVRIASIERELYILGRELAATRQELEYARAAHVLTRELSTWSVQNLDTEYLRTSATQLSDTVRAFVHPLLTLWYPAARAQVQADPAVRALLDVEPGQPLHAQLRSVIALARSIEDQLARADIAARNSAAARRLVAVSFRRPDVDDTDAFAGHTDLTATGFPTSGRWTSFRTADPARASQVWSALFAGSPGDVVVLPEEIYARGGTASLACSQALPIIRHLAFSVIRPGHAFNANPALVDTLLTRVTGDARSAQPLATSAGPTTWQMGAGSWLPIEALYVYTDVHDAATVVSAALYSPQGAPRTDVIGLSPFAHFTIDWASVPAAELAGATELVAWMEIESIPSATPLAWVTSCQ